MMLEPMPITCMARNGDQSGSRVQQEHEADDRDHDAFLDQGVHEGIDGAMMAFDYLAAGCTPVRSLHFVA